MDSLRVLEVQVESREDGLGCGAQLRAQGSQCQAERQGLNAVSRVRVHSRAGPEVTLGTGLEAGQLRLWPLWSDGVAQAKDAAAGEEEGPHMTSSPGLKQLVVDWGPGTSIQSIVDGPWPFAWLWALVSESGHPRYWS